MRTEEIKLLREKYYSLVKENQELLAIKKRISELEQTKEVKEYLYLTDRINSQYFRKEKSDRELVRDAINSSNITPTNDIYVYIGAYKYSSESEIIHGSSIYLASRNDQIADYVVYYNLEAKKYSLDFSREVSYENADKFEREHKVIFPKKFSFNREAYFYDLQDEYFTTVILESEEKAISKIKQLVKKNNRG